ncbi:MAG: Lrp/AsnC family transcriptional regulator [Parvularculaceae bacterium]
MTIDDTDRKILSLLGLDGRMSNQALAARVGLSPSACLRRLKQLERSGAIRGYRAIIDEEALGAGFSAIVHVTLERQTEEALAAFEEAVATCESVVQCHLVSGVNDYILRVTAPSLESFERLHKRTLSALPGVQRIQSSFALREVVNRPPVMAAG